MGLSPWKWLLKHLKRWIRSWPAWIRYPLTIIAFLPTAWYWRLYSWLFPHRLSLWHHIDGTVILGAVPFTEAEIRQLFEVQNVRGVVNMCKEWNWHESRGLYKRLGITQKYLPTIDFDAPSLPFLLEGARFIAEHEARGERVYVHCKAGRGRSTCVVIAYLVLYKGMRAEEAQAFIQSKRSHVSKKWHLSVFKQVEAIAAERRASGSGSGSSGIDSSSTASASAAASSGSAGGAAQDAAGGEGGGHALSGVKVSPASPSSGSKGSGGMGGSSSSGVYHRRPSGSAGSRGSGGASGTGSGHGRGAADHAGPIEPTTAVERVGSASSGLRAPFTDVVEPSTGGSGGSAEAASGGHGHGRPGRQQQVHVLPMPAGASEEGEAGRGEADTVALLPGAVHSSRDHNGGHSGGHGGGQAQHAISDAARKRRPSSSRSAGSRSSRLSAGGGGSG